MSRSRGTRRARTAPETSRREKSRRLTDRRSGSAAVAGSQPAETPGRPRLRALRFGGSAAASAEAERAPTLFFGSFSEPAKQRAEVGGGCAVFPRCDVLDHLFVRRRAVRYRAVHQIEGRIDQDDWRSLSVDVDDVPDVESLALFALGRLAELTVNAFQIDRQPADVDRSLRMSG